MKLLLDEMYSRRIAEQLRELGHDVVSAQERVDLTGSSDRSLFELMRTERRTILTNNVKDFALLVAEAAQAGSPHAGVLFSSDRSLPRRRDRIQVYVDLLDSLMRAHPDDEGLADAVRWLP